MGLLAGEQRGLGPACPLDSGLCLFVPLGPGNSSGGHRRKCPPPGEARRPCRTGGLCAGLAPCVPVSQEWPGLRMLVAPRSHGWLRAKPEAGLAVPTCNSVGVFDSRAGSLAVPPAWPCPVSGA